MKVNRNFVLRKVGGRCVAVPVGSACRTFHGVVRLNATAQLVWESLLAGDGEAQTVAKLLAAYDVTEDRARAAYRSALNQMAEIGALTED